MGLKTWLVCSASILIGTGIGCTITLIKNKKESKTKMISNKLLAYCWVCTDTEEKDSYIEALNDVETEYEVVELGNNRWRFEVYLSSKDADRVSRNHLVQCKMFDVINVLP